MDQDDDAHSVNTTTTHHTSPPLAAVVNEKAVVKDGFQVPPQPAAAKTTIVAHPISAEPSNASEVASVPDDFSAMSIPFEGDQDRSFSPSMNINESAAFTFDKVYSGGEANPSGINESAAFTFDKVYHGGASNTSEFYIESIPAAIQQVKDKNTPSKSDPATAKKEAELNDKIVELQNTIDQITRDLQTANVCATSNCVNNVFYLCIHSKSVITYNEKIRDCVMI